MTANADSFLNFPRPDGNIAGPEAPVFLVLDGPNLTSPKAAFASSYPRAFLVYRNHLSCSLQHLLDAPIESRSSRQRKPDLIRPQPARERVLFLWRGAEKVKDRPTRLQLRSPVGRKTSP